MFRQLVLLGVMCLILGATAAQAGDRAEIGLVGFSPRGDYFAMEQYGTQDGSGWPYSEIYFIGVGPNGWARMPVSTLLEDVEDYNPVRGDIDFLTEARRRTLNEAFPFLEEYGIEEGRVGEKMALVEANPPAGSASIAEPPDDHVVHFDGGTVFDGSTAGARAIPTMDDVAAVDEGDDTSAGPRFTLTLTSKIEEEESAGLPDWMPYLKTLTLTLRDEKTGKVHLIQDDDHLPKSRNYTFSYRIRDVYLYDVPETKHVSVVIIIERTRPGFEGDDTRFFPASARLWEIQ